MNSLKEILASNDEKELRNLFAFDLSEKDEMILFKFELWCRKIHPKFFKSEPAPYHAEINQNNLAVYRGDITAFVDIVHRGGAKTTLTKLWWAFCISNDVNHHRRYFKVLCKDLSNAKQIVTDIYNMLIRHEWLYPEIFAESKLKTEETMGAFTTTTGIKIKSGTVGTDQRGDVQEDARPDQVWFDDFETRKTLRSAVETKSIWDNMEEARTGLAKEGGCIYTCNYISERGNVHRLVEKASEYIRVMIQPLCDKHFKPYWSAYSVEECKRIKAESDDFEGEYLCEPSAGASVFFDRAVMKLQAPKNPIEVVNGFKVFDKFQASHRYGCGADTAGGLGLDSSASVWIDFSTVPAKVVGTFADNEIDPENFGHELIRQGRQFGNGIIAPENNKYDSVIAALKSGYKNIYYTEAKSKIVGKANRTTLGWNTNALTKHKMLSDLRSAIQDGLLELNDKDLIAECTSYSRDDVLDREVDARLTTKHYDLLIACAIAWQMKDWAKNSLKKKRTLPPYQTNVNPAYV